VARLYRLCVVDLGHRHGGFLRQYLWKKAVMRGVKVLDQHVGHGAVSWQCRKQLGHSFKASGGRSDGNDWGSQIKP
jgi:hypothetical protein